LPLLLDRLPFNLVVVAEFFKICANLQAGDAPTDAAIMLKIAKLAA
jgi:hypothetical protein